MRSRTSSVTRPILALVLALMLLTIAARVIPGARTIDDAFITFRYSRNIVEGYGFVYNPGVQTLGTTTPLYTLLMAVISAVTGSQSFPQFALVVNALADAVTVALLYLLMRRLTGSDWLGVVPGLLYALAPHSVTFAIGGMETSVVILWMVAATWVFLTQPGGAQRADMLLGVLVALGLLTRVDSALWVAPLLLFQLGGRWLAGEGKTLIARLPLRTWVAAGLVLLPWMIFSTLYFGSPLPNSLSAKSVAYEIGEGAALVRLIQHYALPFNESDFFTPFFFALGIIYAAMTFVCMAYARKHMSRLLPFLIYPWLYFAAFAIANPLIFRWYLAPPVPALMFGIIGGIWVLARPLQQARLRWGMPLLFGTLTIVWTATTLRTWTLNPDHGPNRPAPDMAWHAIELSYEQMANILVSEYGVTPQTRVASADIGAIGYFTRAIIIDTVGLVTPELSRYYPFDATLVVEGQNYVIPPQLIYDTAPQYLVTMEAFVRLGLASQPEFETQYRLLEMLPFEFYGEGMLLFGRVN
ncbi:MAG: glycosyltransferase family 39 protein [Chloroflexota bacterium]|nr:glycosyltransferase family 39 protein [Chloroflexota bacterium]